jgi:hypothetical protein
MHKSYDIIVAAKADYLSRHSGLCRRNTHLCSLSLIIYQHSPFAMPRLPTDSFSSRRRSLRRPVLDINLAHIRTESQTLREDRFRFEREWQGRTTELLFYDRYVGQVVEYDL